MLERSSGLSGHGVKLQMLLLVRATLASHPLGLLLSSLDCLPQNEHGSRKRKSTPMISAKTGSRSRGDTQTHDLWSLGSTDSSQGSLRAVLAAGTPQELPEPGSPAWQSVASPWDQNTGLRVRLKIMRKTKWCKTWS